MLEQIFYEVEDRIKSQANRQGFVVDEIAIDQNFLRLFRSPFCASFEQYSIFIFSFTHLFIRHRHSVPLVIQKVFKVTHLF
jgi:hypothetical protein